MEAERRERRTHFIQRRSKLSDEEAALLREEVFPEIFAEYRAKVWNRLRRRRLKSQDVEDLGQEVFIALHIDILEHGFPQDILWTLYMLADGKLMNHRRAGTRSPVSIGLASSSSIPGSVPDVERALDLRELVRRFVPQLSAEHQKVIDLVVMKSLWLTEAAAELGLPEGTVKSRLRAARRALSALMEPFLPPSQRGPR